jgi:DNA primase
VPRKNEERVINYMNLADVKSLNWAAFIGCIESHTFLHRYPFISSPTLIAFHLDPGEGMNVIDCCAVALEIQEWFERYGLRSFAKLSRSKGLQVYVPLNTPSSYAITHVPPAVWPKNSKGGIHQRSFRTWRRRNAQARSSIVWSQNAEHKTTVSVYSIRAKREQPYVSVPMTWAEVERGSVQRQSRIAKGYVPRCNCASNGTGRPVCSRTHSRAVTSGIPVRRTRHCSSLRPSPVVVPKSVYKPERLPRSTKRSLRSTHVANF